MRTLLRFAVVSVLLVGLVVWGISTLPEDLSETQRPGTRPFAPLSSAPAVPSPRPAAAPDYESLAIRFVLDPAFTFAPLASAVWSRGSELRVRLLPDVSRAFELVGCEWQRDDLANALRDWQAVAGEAVDGVTVLSSTGRVVGFVKLRGGRMAFHC